MRGNDDRHAAGPIRFFFLGTCHKSLYDYYRVSFILTQHHGWSLSDMDSLVPFELEIFVNMLEQHLEEQQEKMNGGLS